MEKRLIIQNGKVIFPDEIVGELTVVVENGSISAIVNKDEFVPADEDEVPDANNKYLAPGFIDIHTHGVGGHDLMDGTIDAYLGAAEKHARFGTTAMLPTTLASTIEELLKPLQSTKKRLREIQMELNFWDYILKDPILPTINEGHKIPNTSETRNRKSIMQSWRHPTILHAGVWHQNCREHCSSRKFSGSITF